MGLHLGTSFYSGCTIPLPDFIQMCHDLKLEYLEIQLEPPYLPSDMSPKQKQVFKDILASSNLLRTTHAPYDDVNLASLKEPIRRASLEIMKDCVDLSTDIDSSLLVLHAGFCPVNQLARHDDAIQRFRASLLELAMYAHDRGIKIGVENKQLGLDREIILYPDEHLEIIQEYNDFDVGAVIDIGHANTAEIDLAQYVRKLFSYIIEIHLHDNDGTHDSHLGLGEGTANIEGVLSILNKSKFTGPTILELDTKESLEKAISYIDQKTHLR
ncbi:MAG: sugar phosphate isomerase/epimerase family protein [Candidatus Thorarchaeota archaeon]